MTYTVTHNPHDVGIAQKTKHMVTSWADVIVSIQSEKFGFRVCDPREFIEVSCAGYNQASPGYVLFRRNPDELESFNNRVVGIKTNQEHGIVHIHSLGRSGITNCGSCQNELQQAQWWDISYYTKPVSQTISGQVRNIIKAHQYSAAELSAFDVARAEFEKSLGET